MLNNDNDLRPAYSFAYVTEPQYIIEEEEEVNLSPTVFKWFWVVATIVSSVVANQQKKKAEEKANAFDKYVEGRKEAILSTYSDEERDIIGELSLGKLEKYHEKNINNENYIYINYY